MHPYEGENPSFGQIFIYDDNEAVERRLIASQNNVLDLEILTILDTTMRTYKAFTKSYTVMAEVIEIEHDFTICKEIKRNI